MHCFTSLRAKADQLICELMPGNLDRILIRRAGCLILSTVFTEDLMMYALVTYSNSNKAFVFVLFFLSFFFLRFPPRDCLLKQTTTNGRKICFSSILGKLVFCIVNV